MANVSESDFRSTLAAIFSAHRSALAKSLADSLSTPPETGKPYLVEIAPDFYDLSCVSTEEYLLPDCTVYDAVDAELGDDAEAYETAGIDVHAITMDSLTDWIADCWTDAKGALKYPRAFAFIHGYYDQYFDLVAREWVSVDVVFVDA